MGNGHRRELMTWKFCLHARKAGRCAPLGLTVGMVYSLSTTPSERDRQTNSSSGTQGTNVCPGIQSPSYSKKIQLLRNTVYTCIKAVTLSWAVAPTTSCPLIGWRLRHWYHHQAFNSCPGVVCSKLHKATVNHIHNSTNCDGSLCHIGGYDHLPKRERKLVGSFHFK